MRARIYSACRDLSWLAPEQAKQLASVALRARDVVGTVDDFLSSARIPLLQVWAYLEHARSSLLEHVRER